MKLYLAHPFDSKDYIREWELKTEEELGIQLINPFYDTDSEENKLVVEIDAGRKERYDADSQKIVRNDLELIRGSEGIVAIVDGALSFGTIQEMVYAQLFFKPVYSLITNGHEKHPWLEYHSDEIFIKRNDLGKFLKKISSR